jgi:hypothetical protein
MDIGRAFGFVFDDEEWITKILIGGIVFLIPIVNFAAYGYMLQVGRNVMQDNPRPLPGWSDFGDHFMRGLYYIVISLVYAIPIIIVSCIMQFIIPILGAAGGDEAAAAGAGLMLVCFVPLIIILSLVVYMLLSAALVRYIQTDSVGQALQVGTVWNMVRSSPGTYGMLLLVAILAGLVASLGIIACGVGVLFTSVYAYAVIGHTMGQVARQEGGTMATSTPDFSTSM